jgi:hypothetical protein
MIMNACVPALILLSLQELFITTVICSSSAKGTLASLAFIVIFFKFKLSIVCMIKLVVNADDDDDERGVARIMCQRNSASIKIRNNSANRLQEITVRKSG